MLDVYPWSFACPHLVSLFHRVGTLEEDVLHGLPSLVALALIGFGLVDGVQVGSQSDFACAHLRDDRADSTVRAGVGSKSPFARFRTPSRKSSRPCLSVSQDCSHSSRMV